jgi:GTPase SAR1 family protein
MYKSVYAIEVMCFVFVALLKLAMHQVMFVELNYQYGECHNSKISLYFECSELIIYNSKQIQKSLFLSIFEKGHSGSLTEWLLGVTEIKENRSDFLVFKS